MLGHDGADLAAALQTIREIGDTRARRRRRRRLSGATSRRRGRLVRGRDAPARLVPPAEAAELSDGTLRYLLWIAALLSPRPPALLVLNEPETSLHPDLLPALARLVASAAQRSQVLVVSHARRLIAALEEQPGCHSLMLEKELGETRILGVAPLELPPWQWPAR